MRNEDLINEYIISKNDETANNLDSFNYSFLCQEIEKRIEHIIEDHKEDIFDEIEGTLLQISNSLKRSDDEMQLRKMS